MNPAAAVLAHLAEALFGRFEAWADHRAERRVARLDDEPAEWERELVNGEQAEPLFCSCEKCVAVRADIVRQAQAAADANARPVRLVFYRDVYPAGTPAPAEVRDHLVDQFRRQLEAGLPGLPPPHTP